MPGLITLTGLATAWGTVATIKAVNNANERDEVKQEKRELDRRRVEQYNDLVARHNTNLETLSKEREERAEEVGSLRGKLEDKAYQMGLTEDKKDSLEGALNKQIVAYDSLKTTMDEIKDEKADLKNALTNYEEKNKELQQLSTKYKNELENVTHAKRDTINKMQESIYGLLASPFWTRAPRPDRNYVPENLRLIPLTKEDVNEYRDMNREYRREAN